MNVPYMLWEPAYAWGHLADRINVGKFFSVEIPSDHYVARVAQSWFYPDGMKSCCVLDVRFRILSPDDNYFSYPIGRDASPSFGRCAGLLVTNEYLIASETFFSVHFEGMAPGDGYGTSSAGIVDLGTEEAVKVTSDMELGCLRSLIHCPRVASL